MGFKENRSFVIILFLIASIIFIQLASAQEEYPDYTFYPSLENIDYSKPLVLLVHGWSNDADLLYHSWDGIVPGGFLTELNKGDFQIITLQYAPANLSSRKTGYTIGGAINQILNYPGNTQQDKINVIAHSFGGLSTRAYIEGEALNPDGTKTQYGGEIRKLVLIASPQHGSFFANLVNQNAPINILEEGSICANFVNKYKLTGFSEATYDLELGSDVVWDLNKGFNDEVDYLTIAGTRNGERTLINVIHSNFCTSNHREVNDGVVSTISASLVNRGVPMVLLDKFHTNKCSIKSDDIAGKISLLFLENRLDKSSAEPLLNTGIDLDDLECFGWLQGRQNEQYFESSDFNEEGWASIITKINNSEVEISDLEFNKIGFDSMYPFERNQRSGKWYYVDYDYVKNEKIDFSTLLSSGDYQANINWQTFNQIFEIKPGFVNLIEISLNKDGDNYDMQEFGGTDCNDNDATIYPNAPEMCNFIDNNCDGVRDDHVIDLDDGNQCTRDICIKGSKYHFAESSKCSNSKMIITEDTIFKKGNYTISDEIEIRGDNLKVDCRNSRFIGTNIPLTNYVFRLSGENITLEDCIVEDSWGGVEVVAPNSKLNNIKIMNAWYALNIGAESIPLELNNVDIINASMNAILMNPSNQNIVVNNVYFGTTDKTEIEGMIQDIGNKLNLDNFALSETFTPAQECNTEGDTNCDGEVTIFELIIYAEAWVNHSGDVSVGQLMEVAIAWINA